MLPEAGTERSRLVVRVVVASTRPAGNMPGAFDRGLIDTKVWTKNLDECETQNSVTEMA